MKKKILFALLGLLAAVALGGCTFYFDDGGNGNENFGTDLADNEYMKTLTSESSITLTGVQGKTILYANFNASAKYPVYSPRYLVNATGLVTGSVYASNPASPYIFAGRSISADELVEEEVESCGVRHFIPKETFSFKKDAGSSFRSVANITAPLASKTEADFTIGDTEGRFYADNDVSLNSYELKNFALAAKGRDANDNVVCLVWVDKTLYSQNGTCEGETINQNLAAELGSKFAKYYAKEKAVFGDECELLFDKSGYSAGEMSDIGATGSLVNIIIYDIGNDYVKGDNFINTSSDECGVVGYFYAKDYFVSNTTYGNNDVRNYSNGGKYFYIDAAFCNLNGTTKVDGDNVYKYDGVGGSNPSDTVISTLFHEFQHMLNFGQKDIYNVSSPTWYNEMLSMLAEDMMASALGLSNEEAPRGARLPAFNKYYWMSGIDEYLDGRDAVISYSTAYSFGAWLSRTFGGPAFVSAMSKNRYGGMNSVIAAIKEVKGETYSDLQLFKMYLEACAFRPKFVKNLELEGVSLPTHYQDGGGEIEEFKMTKINLASEAYGFAVNNTMYYGPALFNSQASKTVRPHGFVLHTVGTATTDTVTLDFSSRSSAGDQIVIFIQDGFNNTTVDSACPE